MGVELDVSVESRREGADVYDDVGAGRVCGVFLGWLASWVGDMVY